ncbi:TatD family hydrolase [Actinotalea sp. C106]|uniref:TatD family hydrolase n=1 Tax=Actinotalea sp. C106 TaxID=2908644 RepID=UPI002028CFE4|nr:TatD family hydrolase [Actinotalea sp. C106]
MSPRGRERDRSWPELPEPLPAPLVDDHTHLDHAAPGAPGFDGRAEPPSVLEQLERAAAVGVTRMVQIGCDLPAARWTDVAVGEHGALLGGVAIHPNEAPLHAGVLEVGPDGLEPEREARHEVSLDDAITEIADLARGNDRIRVIGETGLDHFRTGERGREVQRESFRAHVALAKELGLALQIHDRDAHAEVIDLLLADGAPERTVFHCFSGDAAMARLCVDRGWYLSFAGPVTFASSHELRAALHVTPLSRVLLETDAPYLTPHPFRGRPNAPYLLARTARSVAAELELDLAALCDQVSANAGHLYGSWGTDA